MSEVYLSNNHRLTLFINEVCASAIAIASDRLRAGLQTRDKWSIDTKQRRTRENIEAKLHKRTKTRRGRIENRHNQCFLQTDSKSLTFTRSPLVIYGERGKLMAESLSN